MSKQYFPTVEPDNYITNGISFDARAQLALRLIEQWGMVQGTRSPEDSAGRAGIDLMPVAEVVDRAFSMAELAFVELEARGWVREPRIGWEEKWAEAGKLEAIKDHHRFEEVRSKRPLPNLEKARSSITE